MRRDATQRLQEGGSESAQSTIYNLGTLRVCEVQGRGRGRGKAGGDIDIALAQCNHREPS